MAERLSDKVREFLKLAQGKEVSLSYLRTELKLNPDRPEWDGLRVLMGRLAQEKIVRPSGRNDGIYKVIKQVQPVRVFAPGRERQPKFELWFPRDMETDMEISFADSVVVREGDLISIGGVKSKGKTTLCLGFTAQNIDKHPVLMGNEYTQLVPSENGEEEYVPSPRFYNRLDTMSKWVNWTDEEGYDKFTLLPVKSDYAEHIVKDRINIIDWINLDAKQLYDISRVLEDIKSNLGRGVAIVAIQKGETAINPRGGQFVRDFSDLEILLDGFGESEDDILLTIKGCKEKTAPIVGKSYAYTIINDGTQIINFREVKKCPDCRGQGYTKGGQCEGCFGKKFVDK